MSDAQNSGFYVFLNGLQVIRTADLSYKQQRCTFIPIPDHITTIFYTRMRKRQHLYFVSEGSFTRPRVGPGGDTITFSMWAIDGSHRGATSFDWAASLTFPSVRSASMSMYTQMTRESVRRTAFDPLYFWLVCYCTNPLNNR